LLKIKISIPGAKENINISQFTGNLENKHNDCIFFVNQFVEDPDFWFIIEEPNENDNVCNIDKSRIILLTAEVAHQSGYYDTEKAKSYLNQFSEIYTCYEIYRDNVTSALPFLPWMINANHGDSIYAENPRDIKYFEKLDNIEKLKTLSVICSNVTWTDFHLKRISFVSELKKHFKDKLDWFGNGVNSIESKWEGIAPYKYHIVIENQVKYNVITEKLYDSFLGLSFPIYSGATNVYEYFPHDSLIGININDLKRSINSIEEVIEEDYFNQYYQSIIVSKNIVLKEINCFTRISTIALSKNKFLPNNRMLTKIILLNNINSKKNIPVLFNLAGKMFRKLGNQLITYSNK